MCPSLRGICVLLLCGCQSIIGSGRPASSVRALEPFDEVHVSGAWLPLELTLGPQRVEVSGDDNLLPVLVTEVIGRTLYLYPQTNVTLSPVIAPLARVSTPSLEKLEVTGEADATAHGIEAVRFSARVAGAGSLTVQGRAYEVTALSTGAGFLDALGLTADHVKATVSGSGSVRVCADDTLEATLTGSGDLVYACSPRLITRTVTGTGRLIDDEAER